MTVDRVRDAYAYRASEYIDLLGSIDATATEDQELVGAWSQKRDGLTLDVGCGPGQWTNFLHATGAEVVGIDPVHEFVVDAQARYPQVDYRLGQAENLDVPDASVAGILAWYSLIHTNPSDLGAVLDEFARVLRPGGSLLLGFFEGPELMPFDHAVTTAYFWPIPELTHRLDQARFTVTETQTRTDEGSRPHGAIIARREHV